MWAKWAELHHAAVGFSFPEWDGRLSEVAAICNWSNYSLKGELMRELQSLQELAFQVRETSMVAEIAKLRDFLLTTPLPVRNPKKAANGKRSPRGTRLTKEQQLAREKEIYETLYKSLKQEGASYSRYSVQTGRAS